MDYKFTNPDEDLSPDAKTQPEQEEEKGVQRTVLKKL